MSQQPVTVEAGDPDELLRLQTLEDLELHDVLGNQVLERLARAAAGVAGVSSAMVNFVGASSQWTQAWTVQPANVPRKIAFCTHTIMSDELLEVPDARLDPRFCENPLVTGSKGLRFYVGVPIGISGQRLGALCALDTEPRHMTPGQVTQLENLGALVNHWLQTRSDELAHRADLQRIADEMEDRVLVRTRELDRARVLAEQASSAKSAFLATMSHEIRTPMNGVLGMLELLERTPIDAQQRDLCQTMHESANVLLGLIDNVLDFAKIEAGHMELHDTPSDMRALVEGTCEGLLAHAVSHDVWLHTFVDPALPSHVLCDPLRLRQVLVNLVGNAIKFSAGPSRAGQVTVRATGTPAGELLLQIQDRGIGIAPEQLDRLFQPFQQGDAETTRRYGGTGLGLAICRRLVAAMGGHIELHSVVDEGTTVRVRLPLRPCNVATPEVHPRLLPSGLRCTWHGEYIDQAQDWLHYLAAAGAPVQTDGSPDEVDERQLVHLCWGADTPFPPIADHCIRLVRSTGRHAERQSDGQLQLPVDVLRRDALIEAVWLLVSPDAELPRSDVPEPMACEQLPSWRPGEQDPVLVAEDNAVNRLVIERQLQQLGIASVLAEDGEQALALWTQHQGRFSLILTDLHMPVLDGYQLTQALHGADPPARCPVIALTANALCGEALRCQQAGMQDYLSKPLSLQALSRVLSRWMPPAPPAPPPDDITLIDHDPQVLLDMLGDNPQDHQTVLDMLLNSLEAAQVELHAFAATGRWGDLAGVAHRFKSSARASGARYLGELLHRMEVSGRAEEALVVNALLPRLVPAINRFREVIQLNRG